MRLRRRVRPEGSVLRRLWPDRNPLRRTTDRLETCLVAGLFVAAAAAAPFAAAAASHVAYASALRAEQAQLAARHQARAVLTEPANAPISSYTVTALVPARGTWTSASGARHSGQVLVPAGSPKGTAIMVWTDNTGQLTSPPLKPSQVSGQGKLAAVGAVAGVVAACLCATAVARYVLNKRRMAAWDADWIVTAQAWNRQRW